jgi:hypothetical protein
MIVTQKYEVEERVEDLLYRATQKSLHSRCLIWRLKGQVTLAPPLFRSQMFYSYLGSFTTPENPLSVLYTNVKCCKYAVKIGGTLMCALCERLKRQAETVHAYSSP